MKPNEKPLTQEEETRLILRSAIPKLPEAVSAIMLADPAVLVSLGLPTADFIGIWGTRFDRQALFDCLRNLANGRPASLSSADGKIRTERSWVAEDGAGVLAVGKQAARFVNIGLLSDDRQRRTDALDAIVATGELSVGREAFWRAAINEGPLQDPQFIALETELEATPESNYRTIAQDIADAQAQFNDLVPLDPNHYAGLLGLATLPATLDEFSRAWLAHAAALDRVRLGRLLRLSGPLSMLPDALVAQASAHLAAPDRLALAQFLQAALDPFSVIAAFEIACRFYTEDGMAELAGSIASRLFDRADPLIQTAGAAFVSTTAITTALTARSQTLAGWPLYAKRLARFVHTGGLLRLFEEAKVDLMIFGDQAMRSFRPQALLADLCDMREAPIWHPQYLNIELLHAIAVRRATAAIAEIEEADRPEAWLKAGERAFHAAVEGGKGIFFFAPTAFAELAGDWPGVTELGASEAETAIDVLRSADDEEQMLGEMIKISISFEIPDQLRSELAIVFPLAAAKLEGRNFLFGCEVGLQLAARWRKPEFSDRMVDLLLEKAQRDGLADPTAAPRLTMIAAAAESDRDQWRIRVGNIARSFACALKSGPCTTNMMRALELLRDFDPDLGLQIAPARSFAILAYDQVSGEAA